MNLINSLWFYVWAYLLVMNSINMHAQVCTLGLYLTQPDLTSPHTFHEYH